jgi:putative NADH-flavin reductase
MQIGLIGASDNIGARIIREGVSRGHRFTAFSRSPQEADTEGVAWRPVDVLESASLRAELAALDVLVNSFEPVGFRLGGDQVVADAEGKSRISYEDYAVALLDEIEIPRHIQRRFTIGY